MSSNDEAISRWNAIPRADIESFEDDGGFPKRHLLNTHLLRLLGDVAGRRVLDAGCGEGYFSRLLHRHGAEVLGVEPADALRERAIELGGPTYVAADLSRLPDLGTPFDAVVCNMVLLDIPEWRPAMRGCVDVLRPGGSFVFSVTHPCFENLWRTWLEHGAYRTREYLREYEIPGGHASNYHRTISTYLNELARLGCQLREVVEPGLDPAVAASSGIDGIEAYVHLPNFLIVSATRVG